MQMPDDSRNSSTVSSFLIINSVFPYSGVFFRMVGIPISMGMMASIPYVIANGHTSGFAGSGSVGPEYPGEFIHPFALSRIQSFF